MHRLFVIMFIFWISLPLFVHGQQKITGIVHDATTKQALPFVTIKFGDSGQGMVADLDGQFVILPDMLSGNIDYIEVRCLGYQSKKITLPIKNPDIYLQPEDKSLGEVVIKPPYDKIRRILRQAIAHKNQNNPDKYDWYRCHVYYKMLADVAVPDSFARDTSRDSRETRDFLNNQHLLMSETYSIRTWRKPQHLQEDVLASRFSGLKKSVFTSLVTDVVPFHAYNDYITLNGKDYHNPVSHGFEQYYKFNLSDEIVQGTDTTWVLSFMPKGHKANDLTGKVYINSDGFAISHIIAKAYDTMLKLNVRIEQEYTQVPVTDSESRWFPRNLNYIIDFKLKTGTTQMLLNFYMKGTSRIDSVTFREDKDFHFDKTHTIRLRTKADELSDSAWIKTRPEPLDAKEIRTYKVIDSLGEKVHLDEMMKFMTQLPVGRLPIGIFDFDLKRLFTYNYYENVRLGLGIQTNERLIKWLSVGGWAGYGFGDAHWKYGAFAEAYADKYKEFVFRAGYTDDLNDPGRIRLSHDLDKSYLNTYLLRKVDETKTFSASVKKKIGYWSLELAGRQQQIIPKYQYALESGGTDYTQFRATEASLTFRYAYAERTAPIFNYYYSLGSRYPIWYGKITSGILQSDGTTLQTPYTQAVTAVAWQKHINRIGNEHFVVEGGKSWSDGPLPLGKLFAGNGYKYDSRGSIQEGLYTFGGLMTIYPYQFYTDQFVSIVYRHDFDWKLYKLESADIPYSSAPNICLQYDMLYGTLKNPAAQQYVTFSVPDNAYNEAGLLLNNLFRLRYASLYYFTINVGYFYHIIPYPIFDGRQNGRFVLGAGIEL